MSTAGLMKGHPMKSNIIDLELQLHHRTNMAVLVSDDSDRDKAVWLPLSIIEIEEYANGTCIVTLPEPFAADKGLV